MTQLPESPLLWSWSVLSLCFQTGFVFLCAWFITGGALRVSSCHGDLRLCETVPFSEEDVLLLLPGTLVT